MRNRFKNKIWYSLYLVIITALLLELALRIYNPFHFRIKGDHIVLDANKTYEIYNKDIPVIDQHITYKKNSLGFRGPERPENFDQYLSIITVGGSTTECQYLNDGKTWSDRLYYDLQHDFNKVWLNNGGLAGHSTFGHVVLLEDHIVKLKPKLILFLVGVNDIERDDLNDSDKSNMTNRYKNILTFLSKRSELCNVLANLVRARRAKTSKLVDTYLDLKKAGSLAVPDSVIANMVKEQDNFCAAYGKRLQKLVDICNNNRIIPVLITQPLLVGKGIDSLSGANLETLKISSKHNGKSFWTIMEAYNDITRQVAERNRVLLIDAARAMPKNSLYFYDMLHYTNAGAEKLGDIVYYQLKDYLSLGYNLHLKKINKSIVP